MHEDINTIQKLYRTVKCIPSGHPQYMHKHAAIIQGLKIRWRTDFPCVSGTCKSCNAAVSGFSIQNEKCNNCKNQLGMHSLSRIWFWAKFTIQDVNDIHNKNQSTHDVTSTAEFAAHVLKKYTNNVITTPEDYLSFVFDRQKDTELNKVLQNAQQKCIVKNAKVFVYRMYNNNKPSDIINMSIDVTD